MQDEAMAGVEVPSLPPGNTVQQQSEDQQQIQSQELTDTQNQPIEGGVQVKQEEGEEKKEEEKPLPPSHTLYVNNLYEKLKEEGMKNTISNGLTSLFVNSVLRKELASLFNPHGNVISILAGSSVKKRGQAWIVYDDIPSAERAMAALQGHNFHGKAMRVAFAKAKSDIIAKRDGTYVERPKVEKRPRTETASFDCSIF